MNAHRSIVEERRRQPGYRAIAALMIPVMLLGSIGSCTSPQTYHRPDGTPYEKEEFDAWETIGAIILFSLALGVLVELDEPAY